MSDFARDSLLVGAAMLGGGINSVAGGGSFFTFPALVFCGLLPIDANATSTVALWPASVGSSVAYRSNVSGLRDKLVPLTLVSLVGGTLGALLLLWTRNDTFARIVPWLLLTATTLFALSTPAVTWLRRNSRGTLHPGWLAVGHFAVSVYGGYFGGGMGILMLAAFAIAGMNDIHAMNGLKSILGAAINSVAVLTFILAGIVHWREALLMVVGSILGGYFGARVAKRLNPVHIRWFVIAVGAALTVHFFLAGG